MRKVILPACLLAAGCSLNHAATRVTAGVLNNGLPAVYEEPDLELAQEAIPAQLELARILLRSDPNNAELLTMTAEGFNGYAFLFLEQSDPQRAKDFYLRGRDYALSALAARDSRLAGLSGLDEADLTRLLQTTGKKDVPALFWAAFGWSNWINLSKDSPQALAQLPNAVAMMSRVLQLNPEFHFAGPDIFFGVYYASRPAILGGDVAKAKKYFEEAIKATQGEYLMDYVLEARYLAVAMQDKSFFKDLLNRVEIMPSGRLPGAMLTDQTAKKQAEALLGRINDYF